MKSEVMVRPKAERTAQRNERRAALVGDNRHDCPKCGELQFCDFMAFLEDPSLLNHPGICEECLAVIRFIGDKESGRYALLSKEEVQALPKETSEEIALGAILIAVIKNGRVDLLPKDGFGRNHKGEVVTRMTPALIAKIAMANNSADRIAASRARSWPSPTSYDCPACGCFQPALEECFHLRGGPDTRPIPCEYCYKRIRWDADKEPAGLVLLSEDEIHSLPQDERQKIGALETVYRRLNEARFRDHVAVGDRDA